MKYKITSIKAREILDSRGNPTVETEIILDKKIKAWASVPSGASTGSREAFEMRDNDPKRYNGKGVLSAVKNVNATIAKKLINRELKDLNEADNIMLQLDGTENKSKLGANAILSVSMALARALAIKSKMPLYMYLRKSFFNKISGWDMPSCMMNIINGGEHAHWTTDIQEYMIIPQQTRAQEQIRCGSEIFQFLKKILESKKLASTVGDEGGFAPDVQNNAVPLEYIMQAISQAKYTTNEVKIGLDVASSEFYNNGTYFMKKEGVAKKSDEMIEWIDNLIRDYPIISVEDGLSENDWDGWSSLTEKIGDRIYLVGDDLFTTNLHILKDGIRKKCANAILIKPNQIGTITETIATITEAKKNGFKIAISHRSGETVDDFITDLAVSCQADFLKAGSLSRGERVAKYNRLMEIEEEVQ